MNKADLKKKEEMEEQARLQRAAARSKEMRDQESHEKKQRNKRDIIRERMAPRIVKQIAGKSYAQLCKDYLPKVRMNGTPDRDAIRRSLRRAMARYHPDRAMHLPTLEEQVEAEVIFDELNKAYQELCKICKQRRR